MIRFVIRAAIFLATAAIGLVVAALSLHDFRVTISGFLLAVIVFAVVQSGLLAVSRTRPNTWFQAT